MTSADMRSTIKEGEMHKMKKIFTLVLAVVLALGTVPIPAAAAP